MCSSSRRPIEHAVLSGMFFILLCKQSSSRKDVLNTDHLKTSEIAQRVLRETGYLSLANAERERQRLGECELLAAMR